MQYQRGAEDLISYHCSAVRSQKKLTCVLVKPADYGFDDLANFVDHFRLDCEDRGLE